jgi:hypothetical protein
MDSQGIQTLEPLLGSSGVDNSIPVHFLGNIMLFRSRLLENNTINWDAQSYEILATPPATNSAELDKWFTCVPHYNMVLVGSPILAQNFFDKHGTYYRYTDETELGTRFSNSINYGILNCTNQTLYQVDDTAHYANKSSDIYELRNGDDNTFPLWTQQEANNQYNLDNTREYIRIYRYGGQYDAHNVFSKCMRETIIYWDKQILTHEGFLYVPSHQVCLFDTREKAQWFLNTYHSIELYQRTKLVEELETTLKARYKDYEAKLKAKNDTVIKGCGVFVGLTLAWKLGEIILGDMKKPPKPKENPPSEPPSTVPNDTLLLKIANPIDIMHDTQNIYDTISLFHYDMYV